MTLRLYNTLTQSKEEFVPATPGKVKMYVCGVTVYDMCHIGHARSQIVFDTVFRYLKYKGYDVTYARNFTDIDDKIINRANETGRDWKDLTATFIDEFYTDMDMLGVQRPTLEPKATEHMDQIIAIVSKLVKNGFAYELDGDVYFEVSKFEGYGKLSKRNLEDLQAGARVQVDTRKKTPMDFALWKKCKPGEPSWDSPWGPGRPGWHIECSAMSNHHLGESFDIHGGGKDLIFPHHENEIAQSEAATGKTFAKYWMHNGFVQIDSEKMSKSLGNFFTIRDVLKVYPPEAIRMFMVASHYRSPIDYSDKALADTLAGLDRIYGAWETLLADHAAVSVMEPQDLDKKGNKLNKQMDQAYKDFMEAMDDDFNMAKALGHLFDLVRVINTISLWPADKMGKLDLQDKALGIFETFRSILGIPLRVPEEYRKATKELFLKKSGITADKIDDLIKQRTDARANKDFARADQIRDELLDMGIAIKDSAEKTTWNVKFSQ